MDAKASTVKKTKTAPKGVETKKSTQAKGTTTKVAEPVKGAAKKVATPQQGAKKGTTPQQGAKKGTTPQQGAAKGTNKATEAKKPTQAKKAATKTAEVNAKADTKKRVNNEAAAVKPKVVKPAVPPNKEKVAIKDTAKVSFDNVITTDDMMSGDLASAQTSFAMITERLRTMDHTLLSSVFMVVAILALAFGCVRVAMNKYRWYRIGQSKKHDSLPNKWEDVYGRHPMADTA